MDVAGCRCRDLICMRYDKYMYIYIYTSQYQFIINIMNIIVIVIVIVIIIIIIIIISIDHVFPPNMVPPQGARTFTPQLDKTKWMKKSGNSNEVTPSKMKDIFLSTKSGVMNFGRKLKNPNRSPKKGGHFKRNGFSLPITIFQVTC